ncbi:PRC-barrel domain-containing protein [Falsigemmobacter faecalis]|uniref:PRC-barrel domain containing protein n=1 Tax=Falsigemmobacter faecalis TaxID=2488730 RepID=A0A3P3D352_9RHOB|nr:PRC-barrel domain-containing protein [Falsigemmobacter faecalis]RRH68840.1 PRC-barrel domain containing protein [Falsigemmobacter faecalis]
MDHSSHSRLSPAEYSDHVLSGAAIYGPENARIGSVAHVHGSGPEAQVIIDVGGFLGMGAKPVAVPARDLDFMRDESGVVHAVTTWTKDQLKAMPEHHH